MLHAAYLGDFGIGQTRSGEGELAYCKNTAAPRLERELTIETS